MLGFVLVVVGSFSLALQNVLLRVVFVPCKIGGWFVFGGLLPANLDNSLFVLQLRSLLILPLVLLLASLSYAATWKDLAQLGQPPQRRVLLTAVGSSSLMYLAMACLFVAIANISTGIAVALFFIHPAYTVLLSWVWFGDRPTYLRFIVLGMVFTGSVLLVPKLIGNTDVKTVAGVMTAIAAGIFYSLQGLTAQTCMRTIHPLVFTVVNFTVMAILSTVSLLFIAIDVPTASWPSLWVVSLATAILTLVGQMFYNFGIHLTSAAVFSMIAVSNPAFTAFIAWLGIQESLQPRQVAGIVMITLGVMALSLERKITKQPQQA